MDEIDLVLARLAVEEGFVSFLYDDVTDLPVRAAKGNATIGYGCNVQAGWSKAFALEVLKLQVSDLQAKLLQLSWYSACNSVRRSVLLDIAFNDGFNGLVLGFPRMIAAITRKDWRAAQLECKVTNAVLRSRYTALSNMLLTGQIAS